MKTNELLQLQALKFKERVMEDRPDFDEVDGMPAWMRDNYDANAETRNICAMIPVALFDEIQRLADHIHPRPQGGIMPGKPHRLGYQPFDRVRSAATCCARS